MTTVAYDGRYLAADTRVTVRPPNGEDYFCAHCGGDHHVIQDNSNKITVLVRDELKFRGEHVRAVGQSGNQGASKTLIGLLRNSNDNFEKLIKALAPLKPSFGCNLLVLTDKAIYDVDWFNAQLKVKRLELTEQIAIGSGTASAHFLMKMGGNMAPTAVAASAIASKSTGGRVHILDTHATGKDFAIHNHPMPDAEFVRTALATVLGTPNAKLLVELTPSPSNEETPSS